MRRVAWLWLLLVLVPGIAVAEPKKKSAEPVKAALHVRSIELERRTVTIELVGGPQRPPAANLFTFTDERGRHFVAVSAKCGEPFAPGVRSCELELPAGYERHKLVGLQLHLGSLKGRSLTAPAAEFSAEPSAEPSAAPEASP